MLTHPTLDRLQQLGLTGMASAFGEIITDPDNASLSHAEWLALLLERETSHRHDRRLAARLRYAKLRHQAAIEDVDYRAVRGLDRALFQKLAGGGWIDAHENLILCGPTGIGKSWLASALGHKACRDNRSVLSPPPVSCGRCGAAPHCWPPEFAFRSGLAYTESTFVQ